MVQIANATFTAKWLGFASLGFAEALATWPTTMLAMYEKQIANSARL